MIDEEKRSDRVIQFIECLTVPSGVGAGGPMVLREWQKKFIRDIYDPVDSNGKRIVRRAVKSIGRKNGKTALIAALVLVHLIGPEAEENGEIYSAATEKEQAAQVFKFCTQFIRADEELDSLLKIIDSTKRIINFGNGSFYKALSAEAGSKHGLNPTFVIYDELAQARDRELYDVLDTSMGAREEPLFVTISTQSNDPQHILSQLIDDGLNSDDPTTVTHLYEVPMKCEDIYDEKVWYLANPALGDFRLLEDLRTMAKRAKRMPSFEATFRNLYLNQRVDAQSPLIPRAEWAACKDNKFEFEDGEDLFLALDLSGSTDLTCLVALSAENGDRCKAWFYKPKELVKDHETRDRVPYRLWVKRGVIIESPGRTINHGFVAKTIGELNAKYNIVGLAYDRWRIEDFKRSCDEIGLECFVEGKDKDIPDAIKLIPWGQGFKDMSPAIDALETSILERTLKHDGNPCLTWNISNAISNSDPAGNRKFDKTKTRFRIDGAVSLAMATGLKSKKGKEKEPDYQIFVL